MNEHDHSVVLDSNKCIGCTDCIKRCPTEAIRVREGKAVILDKKCIDCGLCIKVCSNHAKKAATQNEKAMNNYKYKIAIPAPAIYSQFKNMTDINRILTAIKKIGFDKVYEVAGGAEYITRATNAMMVTHDLKKPIISSACPAIIRLISMRFPSLIENILPIIAPVELTAIAAKNYIEQTGIPREDIGVFFISPCAAKNTYKHNPLGIEKSEIDAVISIQDIYMPLLSKMRSMTTVENLVQSVGKGIRWAASGGESSGIYMENAIAVDGVENVIKVLEELENGQLQDVDFIEGLACIGGCLGGPLTVENSFVAKNRLNKIRKAVEQMSVSERCPYELVFKDIPHVFTKEISDIHSLSLDQDIQSAIAKMERIDDIFDRLPQIDCGSCGSPTCRTLAEDIVNDYANEEDCIFMLRKKVTELAESMVDLSSKLPQTLSARSSERK